ncbi:unnamed protein product [Phytophthora lilii]|uniref:Unnamed protein product n=1 Tax=Phytophthora lilii TaxID=2077276 RepID=A0A9W6WVR3_9STRA|nr:unnamed protein product [Phytophthora lilii]
MRSHNEQYEHVVRSIRNSIEPRILDHLARFVIKKRPTIVTDEDLGPAITRRCSTLQNNNIPDMDKLFKDKLKMDLKIEDTEARILNYFVLFDQIVEDHGLGRILEMERLAITKPVLKKDDIALYEALVERAREQQHYHMLTQEMKHGEKTRAQSKGSPVNTKRPANPKSTAQQTAAPIGKHLEEQLAVKVEPEHDEDDIAEDDILGMTSPDEIIECIDSMLTNAVDAGFPKEQVAALSDIVKEVSLWRTKLGADPPAKLDPLRVVLMEDTTPYRTKPRQYSTTKTRFLSEYGKQITLIVRIDCFGLFLRIRQCLSGLV